MGAMKIKAAIVALSVTGATVFSTQPTFAQEATISAPNAPEELQDTLAIASSLIGIGADQFETPQEVLAAARSDYRTLVQVLYDAGYFGPTVSIRMDGREVASIPPLETPSKINKVEIFVDPGPQFKFGTAQVAPVPPETELPDGFKTGEIATTSAIRDAGAAGTKAWRNVGHAKATLGAQRITADHTDNRIDADLEIIPGPELRFGALTITGETDVNEDAIRRIAGFPSGEKFDPAKAQLVGTRLRRTGTFQTVALREAETPNPDGTLDYTAEFSDLPKRRLSFGAEISSNEGIDLSADWMHRNLFGNAEKLRIEARVSNLGGTSSVDGRIGVRLDRPDTFGPDDSSYYLLEGEIIDEEHYRAAQALIGAGVRRQFSQNLFAEAGLVGVFVRADDVFGSERDFSYIGLPFKVEWDKRDNKVSATKGHFLSGTAMPFVGVRNMPEGVHLSADGRYYQSLDSNGRFVLAGRLQIGSVLGANLAETPPTLLFYSGGAGSVRGQPFESLGVPINGGTAGGRSYVAAAGEIRGFVTEKLALVGFYDIGFIGPEAFIGDTAESHSGAGIGIRYDIAGIGPLRLDIATPVDGDTDDGIQFYIGIGQAF